MTMLQAARPSDSFDWVQAHTVLSRLARDRAAADAEEGRWMLRALRSAAHLHMACGSFAQYIERLFGYDRRTTQEKLRIAEALEALPQLARELEAGALCWSAVRELTRVAAPETESAWLDAARGKTVREIEGLVATRRPGDLPGSPATPPPRAHELRFEVAPETYALFREAVQQLRRAAGGFLDDDGVLLSMARHVLAGPRDHGRAAYQVSLTVCAVCRSGQQLGGGELVPVGNEIVAMAECDAQDLGPVLPLGDDDENPSRASSDMRGTPAATPRRSAASAGGTAAPACATASSTIGPCNGAHVDAPAEQTEPIARARQAIPPAVRRAVLLRDHGRCRVPGCTHSTFLDVHHITPRAEGGANTARNTITLCSAHHRAVHRGQLSIEQAVDGTLTFRHADGTPYGHAVAPGTVDAHAKVFSALRHLGFPERDVKAVLAQLLQDEALREARPDRLLREALRRIRPAKP